jgi:hypothetical protein
MSIIQNFIPFLIPTLAIAMTQTIIYIFLTKNHHWKFVVLGNLILLSVGVLFSLIGFVVAQGEPGSWAGLGFVILLMISFITTIISIGISIILYMFLKPKRKA